MNFLIIFALAVLVQCTTENVMMENPNLLQGDILLQENGDSKNANIVTKKWLNGRIPYLIDSSSGYTSSEISIITSSMRTIESQTGNCLTFVPRTTESSYLIIRNTNTGCNSYVGQINSQPQQVSLERPGCIAASVVVHELLHAAGFEHEHCRIDRDNYINIVWNNVDSVWNYAFDKISATQASTLGLPYDFYSVMHYRKDAFTKNGLDTVTSKVSGVNMAQVGIRGDMSPTDVQKIKKHYNCV
jgi:hypothetical protein